MDGSADVAGFSLNGRASGERSIALERRSLRRYAARVARRSRAERGGR